MVPTECKYCGCEEVATKTDSEIVFRCWSSYVTEDDHWTVSNNCGARCAVQLVELRERIQRAVELLKGQDAVPAMGVDQVIEILEGETDGKAD